MAGASTMVGPTVTAGVTTLEGIGEEAAMGMTGASTMVEAKGTLAGVIMAGVVILAEVGMDTAGATTADVMLADLTMTAGVTMAEQIMGVVIMAEAGMGAEVRGSYAGMQAKVAAEVVGTVREFHPLDVLLLRSQLASQAWQKVQGEVEVVGRLQPLALQVASLRLKKLRLPLSVTAKVLHLPHHHPPPRPLQ